MFKQPLDVRSSAPISGAERKKLRQTLSRFLSSSPNGGHLRVPSKVTFEERVPVQDVGMEGAEVGEGRHFVGPLSAVFPSVVH